MGSNRTYDRGNVVMLTGNAAERTAHARWDPSYFRKALSKALDISVSFSLTIRKTYL